MKLVRPGLSLPSHWKPHPALGLLLTSLLPLLLPNCLDSPVFQKKKNVLILLESPQRAPFWVFFYLYLNSSEMERLASHSYVSPQWHSMRTQWALSEASFSAARKHGKDEDQISRQPVEPWALQTLLMDFLRKTLEAMVWQVEVPLCAC